MSSNKYTFARIEIFLIFMFILFITLIAFVFGVKIGKDHSFEDSGFIEQDKQKVEFLSNQEEEINTLTEKGKNLKENNKQQILDETYQQLKFEFEKLDQHQDRAKKDKVKKEAMEKQYSQARKRKAKEIKDHFQGKYTIQLGSYRKIKDAERFADGFRVRGYNPIISNVKIKNRGIWHRVSLGVFKTVAEAKEYIIKEKSLFFEQDYVIGKFN